MKSILLVDDDPDENLIFMDALALLPQKISLNYEYDAEMALIKMCNKGYDVIFLDLNMPKLDGIECAKRIRMLREYMDTLIVLYSSRISKEKLAELSGFGNISFMEKLPSIEDLAQKLGELFHLNEKSNYDK